MARSKRGKGKRESLGKTPLSKEDAVEIAEGVKIDLRQFREHAGIRHVQEAVDYRGAKKLLDQAEDEIKKLKPMMDEQDSSMAHRPLRNAIQALLRVAAELGTQDVTRGIPANLKGVL